MNWAPTQEHLPISSDALIAGALYEVAGETMGAINWAPTAVQNSARTPWKSLGPWRMVGEDRSITYTYYEEKHTIALNPTGKTSDEWSVRVDAATAVNIACVFGNNGLILLRREATQALAYVQRCEGGTEVVINGRHYMLAQRQPPDVDSAARGSSIAHSQKVLTAPMAGTIVKIQAHDGDIVEQRQVLVILSAMKMEHAIAAPYAGKIRHVYYQEGAVVKGGATIIEME